MTGSGPQTETGQVLLGEMAEEVRGRDWWLAMILNIEGQARAQQAAAALDAADRRRSPGGG